MRTIVHNQGRSRGTLMGMVVGAAPLLHLAAEAKGGLAGLVSTQLPVLLDSLERSARCHAKAWSVVIFPAVAHPAAAPAAVASVLSWLGEAKPSGPQNNTLLPVCFTSAALNSSTAGSSAVPASSQGLLSAQSPSDMSLGVGERWSLLRTEVAEVLAPRGMVVPFEQARAER